MAVSLFQKRRELLIFGLLIRKPFARLGMNFSNEKEANMSCSPFCYLVDHYLIAQREPTVKTLQLDNFISYAILYYTKALWLSKVL